MQAQLLKILSPSVGQDCSNRLESSFHSRLLPNPTLWELQLWVITAVEKGWCGNYRSKMGDVCMEKPVWETPSHACQSLIVFIEVSSVWTFYTFVCIITKQAFTRTATCVWLGFGCFSIPSQEIALEERLLNDLLCVEWDVRPCSIPSRWLSQQWMNQYDSLCFNCYCYRRFWHLN